jgi:hypothetical protein
VCVCMAAAGRSGTKTAGSSCPGRRQHLSSTVGLAGGGGAAQRALDRQSTRGGWRSSEGRRSGRGAAQRALCEPSICCMTGEGISARARRARTAGVGERRQERPPVGARSPAGMGLRRGPAAGAGAPRPAAGAC